MLAIRQLLGALGLAEMMGGDEESEAEKKF